MTEGELKKFKKSVGKAVQNLGFLSTSLKKQIANNFFENILF